MRLRPFTAIALLHPKNQVEVVGAKDFGEREEDQTSLIAGPTVLLAADENQAKALAGRIIPEAMLNKSARIEILVHPF